MKKDFAAGVIYAAVIAILVMSSVLACSQPGASDAKVITAFSIGAAVGAINQASHTINVAFTTGPSSFTGLIATFTATGQKVTVNGVVQTSGTTANDFTNPVSYVVTAADGSTVSYAVTTLGGTTAPCTSDAQCTSGACTSGHCN